MRDQHEARARANGGLVEFGKCFQRRRTDRWSESSLTRLTRIELPLEK